MDTFHEQLVKIKPTATVIVSKIIIWLMAVIIAAIALYATLKVTPILLFAAAGVLYLAYKATASFNIEYEYSVTNGTVDIDKIVNKSSRKRLFTFECKEVEAVNKYSANNEKNTKRYICTDDMDNALVFLVNTANSGRCEIVISPNEKLMDNMKIFLPRAIGYK